LYDREGIFIVIHNIKRLQFNLLDHEMIPKVTILNEEETREFTIKYDIKDIMLQVPEISRFDPLALALCMRPRQICKLIRNSTTSLESIGYRVCV
jgi:DNA-directed RNA polymerase subunit H (RpoH/RPB5)